MEKIILVKIDDDIIDDEKQLSHFLNLFNQLKNKKILIHNGGKYADDLCRELKLNPEAIKGNQIADHHMLKMIALEYAALSNTKILDILENMNSNVLGLTAADEKGIIQNNTNNTDFSNNISNKNINTNFIINILEKNFIPVLSTISSNHHGRLFNINTNNVATAIAIALVPYFKVHLVYCGSKINTLKYINSEKNVISVINDSNFNNFVNQNNISSEMISKVSNAIQTVNKGVSQIVIKNANDLLNENEGTIVAKQ